MESGWRLLTWLGLNDVCTDGNAGDHDAGMDMDVHVENECHAESDNFVIGSAPLPDVDDNAFDDDEAFDSEHGQGMESVADQE